MRVLLTGAFGAIGYRVIEALLAAGHEVVAFDVDTTANRTTARDFGNRIAVIWDDITNPQSVATAVSRVEAVIHNAAIIPPRSETNPDLAERVNVGGTRNVLAAMRRCTPTPLLVFPSSVSVHGHHLPGSPAPRRITDPVRAEDGYAGHKIQCETLIEQSGLPWVIVRIGACMEGRRAAAVESSLLRMIFGIAARCRIEYVHPKDVATAMANAIATPAAVGRKFFLGGGASCQTHWGDFASLHLEALGCGRFPDDAFGTQGYYTDWMDTDDAQRVLRFQRHTLADYRAELDQRFKWIRPLLIPFRGILRRYLLSQARIPSP